MAPECSPLREPCTLTERTCDAGAPAKLIWVWGSPVTVPGVGVTSTGVPASRALWIGFGARHAGAAAAAEATGPEAAGERAARLEPQAATPTAATTTQPAASP